jgi:hypothetical protein
MLVLHGIPDQPRIEAHRGAHREHHHGAEARRRRTSLDSGQPAQLHQCDEEGDDVDVEHRPAAHQFHQTVEPRSLHGLPGRTHLHGYQQEHQGDDLKHRNQDAGDEHDHRQRPRTRGPQENHAAHDRVCFVAQQCVDVRHGEHVGRNVQDHRGKQACPCARNAIRFAQVQAGAATRTVSGVCAAPRLRNQLAGMAGK